MARALLVLCMLHMPVAARADAAPQEGVLLAEDFEAGMDDWWVEGGVDVRVEEGRLYVDADPEGAEGYVCTVWCKQGLSGDVRIEFDAHVLSSSANANNINFFFHYSDPAGDPLYDTRDERESAAYGLYHELNGYICTFLNDTREENLALPPEERKARVRIRRCPGFDLLAETYDYRCREGVTYHVEILRQGGVITFSVDGEELLTVEDLEPLDGGLIGLRTFRTRLWWDNIRVTRP